MPIFAYSALQADGRKRQGTLNAANEASASTQLKQLGLRPIDIRPSDRKRLTQFESGTALSARAVSEFAQELSGLLSAGAPLRQALDIQSAGKRREAEIARSVKQSIESGQSLSAGLRDQGGAAELLAEFVEAGQAGGRLEPMLNKAAQTLMAREDATKKIRGALAYPLFILILAICALFVITVYVAPALEPTLQDTNSDSFILNLAEVGEFIRNNQRSFLLGFAGLIATLFLMIKSGLINKIKPQLAWRLPLIGTIARDLEAGQSIAVLAALLAAGRSMDSALKYAARVSNPVMRQSYLAIAEELRDGRPFPTAMENAQHLPYEIKRLAVLGAQSSALPQALEQAADICSKRAARMIDRISAIIEPTLVIGLGVGISLLLISVLGSLSNMGDFG